MFLFVHPPTGTLGRSVYYPSGLMSVFNAVTRHRPSDLLDLEYLTRTGDIGLLSETFLDRAAHLILERKPSVVGFGTLASNYHIVIALARRIKRTSPGTNIILGGPQASALACETVSTFHDIIDAIVIGEGERTTVELSAKGFCPETMGSVPGIAFHSGSRTVVTKQAEMIPDLDELPLGEASMQHVLKYSMLCEREDLFPYSHSIEAGRGCPFRCSFCSTSPMWRRVDRRKSPGRIFREMQMAAGYTKNPFALTHDNFTASMDFLRSFCGHMTDMGSPYRWTASSRGDILTRDDMQLMRSAGCDGLFIGIESGSRHMQGVFNKRLDLERTVEVIDDALKCGMQIKANFILGHPEETEDDANSSLMLAVRLASKKGTDVHVMKMCPLAGSHDHRRYKNKIYFTPYTSGIAERPFHLEETEELIRLHPDLFLSFGSFPCRYLDDEGLVLTIELFEVIFEHYPRLVGTVFERTDFKPLGLFHAWRKWMEGHVPSHPIDRKWIRRTFSEFFESSFINRSSCVPAGSLEGDLSKDEQKKIG